MAGGFGTRLSEYTEVIPKPMIQIGEYPILMHIMKRYAMYGHKDFHIALGYKAHTIKDYFLNYRARNADLTVNLGTGNVVNHNMEDIDWNVTLLDTGLNTMTGGRLLRMKSFLQDGPFMLTYGDGVADIDLDKLLAFHRSHKKMITVTAVRPAARFGELELLGDSVISFQEKPQLGEGWINGGFFIIEPEFFDYIQGDETFLEREPLVRAAKDQQLMAYRHDGFWQCMDTKRDHESLQLLWEKGAPWKVK